MYQDGKRVYYTPKTFERLGTFWNGRLGVKNTLEGGIVCFIIYKIEELLFINIVDSSKILIYVCTLLPLFLLFQLGINGLSITQYIRVMFNFVRNRRRLFFRKITKNDYKIKEKKVDISFKNTINISNGKELLKSRIKNKKKEITEIDLEKSTKYPNIQNEIPVEDIYRGMIITTDKRYLKIIEVLPISFNNYDESSKDMTINNFYTFLRIAPYEVQIKIKTNASNPIHHIKIIKENMRNEKSNTISELAINYRNFYAHTASSISVSRKYFLIYEYYNTGENQINDLDVIADNMDSITDKIELSLSSCGNIINRQYENEDEFIAEILYNHFNKKSCRKESYTDRVKMLNNGAKALFKDEEYKIPFVDKIAPKGINFEHKKYVIADGLYHTHIMIKKDSFPEYTTAGAANLFLLLKDNEDLDIFIKKVEKSVARSKVSTMMNISRPKAIVSSESAGDDKEDDKETLDATSYIRSRIKSEDLFYMTFMITISAETREKLYRRKKDIIDDLDLYNLSEMSCYFEEEQAYKASMMMISLSKFFRKRTDRNILTEGMSSYYPFTQKEINDKNGVFLAVDTKGNNLFCPDLFNTSMFKNANIYVCGSSGAGKTFFISLLGERLRIAGIEVYIITSKKSHEFIRLCKKMDGSYITFSGHGDKIVNPFDVQPTVNPLEGLIDSEDFTVGSALTNKVSFLEKWFKIGEDGMTSDQIDDLNPILMSMYKRFGIDVNDDSLYLDKEKKTLKTPPIMQDLFNEIELSSITQESKNSLKKKLNKYIAGNLRNFNNYTKVDLNNSFTVVSLEGLKGTDFEAKGTMLALDFVGSNMKSDVTKKKIVIIEEAWDQIGASANEIMASLIEELFRTIRGYRGGAVLVTQLPGDGTKGKNQESAEAIIASCASHLILNLNNKAAEKAREVFELSNNEVESVKAFMPGYGLFCSDKLHIPIYITASKMEKELITTDGGILEELKKRRIKERD